MDYHSAHVMPTARLCTIVALGWYAAGAGAAVTCEQLGNIAYTTVQLRNHGQSLGEVLAEADKLESSGKFTRAELDLIKDVVERAFKSAQTPLEVVQTCKQQTKR